MNNEISDELLDKLIESFLHKNRKLFEKRIQKITTSENKTESENFYALVEEDKNKNQLIKNFYEEVKYIHNIEINYEVFLERINEILLNLKTNKKEVMERLKKTNYITNFVYNNHNSINPKKIYNLIEFLKEKGFYPLNEEDLSEYIKSIKILEEDIPFKPDELKTKLDEEFKEYMVKLMSLLETQRKKLGVGEDKFKKMILKTLKIYNPNIEDPKYDYKTKKYIMLKEIAEQSEEIEPYYIVKYYNIKSGKVYYSIYYEGDILLYNMLPSKEKALEIIKKALEKGYEKIQKPNSQTSNTTKTSMETSNTTKAKIKPYDDELDNKNLSYDEETIHDREFIEETIQEIHKNQEIYLRNKGVKFNKVFKVIAWVLSFTFFLTPFAFMIFLLLRTDDAIREVGKSKPKTFIKITKILAWFFIITIVLLPIGIPLLMLSNITEKSELKYKIEKTSVKD